MTSALDDILSLADEPPRIWHIDPKDDDPRDELARQSAFLRDVRIICPAVDIIAVPNAGKRSPWAAQKAKREGLTAGALDLGCAWEGGRVAFLEFKDGKKMPTPAQRERLDRYVRQGHLCGVFRQEASALGALRRWGAPFLVREGRL